MTKRKAEAEVKHATAMAAATNPKKLCSVSSSMEEFLPAEAMNLVLQHLDPVALLHACHLNRKWRALAQPEWKRRDKLLVRQGGYNVKRQRRAHFYPMPGNHFYGKVQLPMERVLRFHSAALLAQTMEQSTKLPELWYQIFCNTYNVYGHYFFVRLSRCLSSAKDGGSAGTGSNGSGNNTSDQEVEVVWQGFCNFEADDEYGTNLRYPALDLSAAPDKAIWPNGRDMVEEEMKQLVATVVVQTPSGENKLITSNNVADLKNAGGCLDVSGGFDFRHGWLCLSGPALE